MVLRLSLQRPYFGPMRAARLIEIGKPLVVTEVPVRAASHGMSMVRIHCAALNRRDFWMTQGKYPGIRLPAILGSDGAGICDGQEVVINPGLRWGPSETVQGKDFHILGMPEDGTLADEVVVPTEQIYPKPVHLTWEEAAALPLAGVTAYRALFVQGLARPGQDVLITGIGGGVAQTAMRFALASQMHVTVTSGSDDKLDLVRVSDHVETVNYRDADWITKLLSAGRQFDLVLDSAGGETFGPMVKLVKPGGRMVIYGGTAGKIKNLSPQLLFWRQISIWGSSMGSPADFAAMLDFVNTHQIRPVVDSVFALDEINDAIHKLEKSDQMGKIVVKVRP